MWICAAVGLHRRLVFTKEEIKGTMAKPKLCPAFVFLFFCIKLASANVLPPTNVTIECHNLNNTLRWHYDNILDVRFQINVTATGGGERCRQTLWADFSEREKSISLFSAPDITFLVTVVAVVTHNESKFESSAAEIIYSYSQTSLDGQKCFLELPSINVMSHPNGEVAFEFTHPWQHYRKDLHKKCNRYKQKTIPSFNYDVIAVGKPEQHHTFVCDESVCTGNLHVHGAQAEYCLELTGEMEQMGVKLAQTHCTHQEKATHGHASVYIIGVVVASSVIVLIVLFMGYFKLTRPASSLPSFMEKFPTAVTTEPGNPLVDVLIVDPSSPTPLLTNMEEVEDRMTPAPAAIQPRFDIPEPLPSSGEAAAENVEEVSPKEERCPYMPGNNLDDDDNGATVHQADGGSGYESRECFGT